MEAIKFYGAEICKDCRAAHPLLQEKGIGVEYIDITASTACGRSSRCGIRSQPLTKLRQRDASESLRLFSRMAL